MKLINIFPVGNMCLEYGQDMHMFLTHLVENYSMYADNAARVPGYKILDNSLIECDGAMSMETVLHAAEMIHADEIILPDVFQQGPETLQAVRDALAYLGKLYLDRNWPYKLMAVAQGRDEKEWYECYKTLLGMPEIDVIGIPKVLAKMHPKGRPYFVNNLCNLGVADKEHHLLGLWYSLSELNEYDNLDRIRSCDTVLVGYFAKNNMNLLSVRPDGFTVDLEKDVIDYTYIVGGIKND